MPLSSKRWTLKFHDNLCIMKGQDRIVYVDTEELSVSTKQMSNKVK